MRGIGAAVGLIDGPAQAETSIANGKAHAVYIGRMALRNLHWAAQAAALRAPTAHLSHAPQ